MFKEHPDGWPRVNIHKVGDTLQISDANNDLAWINCKGIEAVSLKDMQ